MNENLQYEIEDYILGKMTPEEQRVFEAKAEQDDDIQQEIAQLRKVREALIVAKTQPIVQEARIAASKPKSSNGFLYTLGTFAAAASIVLFMLSSPIILSNQAFDYRGENTTTNTESQARENEFEKARQLLNEQKNTTAAIEILEKLQNNENVSRNYQNESKWMLVIAYLQTNQPQKAEKTFSEINCEDIDCPFSGWDKAKIKWQIFWKKLF